MSKHVYKKIEVVGSSPVSVDDAIKTGIEKVSASVECAQWFEVSEIRGDIEDGKVAYIQVTMKVGFTVES